jgi:cytochrome b involved in lipid metabolism
MGCGSSEPVQDFSLPGQSRVVYATASRRRVQPTYEERGESLYSDSRAYSNNTITTASSYSNSKYTNEDDAYSSYSKSTNETLSSTLITRAEFSRHTTSNSLWICIDGKVFDVTSFQNIHPGGVDNLLYNGGRDATKIFYASHGPHISTNKLPCIGRLVK